MTYLEMLNHYTCGISKNKLKRVLKKWENYLTVTEWGYSWIGGYLIEMIDGKLYHLYGWRENDAQWMNDAWVYVRPWDAGDLEVQSKPWQDYLVEVDRG